MPITAKRKEKTAIPPLPDGTYPANCIGVVELGTQYNERFKNYQLKALFIFEISGETVGVKNEAGEEEQKPRWLSKEFTLSLDAKSNLAKTLTVWLGADVSEADDYDVPRARQPAFGDGSRRRKRNRLYNNINAIISPPKGMTPPPAVSEQILFEFDSWDDKVFDALPEWIRAKITRSTEYSEKYAKNEKLSFDGAKAETSAQSRRSPSF